MDSKICEKIRSSVNIKLSYNVIRKAIATEWLTGLEKKKLPEPTKVQGRFLLFW